MMTSCGTVWKRRARSKKTVKRLAGTWCAGCGKKYGTDGYGCAVNMQHSGDASKSVRFMACMPVHVQKRSGVKQDAVFIVKFPKEISR